MEGGREGRKDGGKEEGSHLPMSLVKNSKASLTVVEYVGRISRTA